MKCILSYLFALNILFSEIVYESGSLSDFFSSESPNSSYDNWISHVTEGIAIEDYNDYGPDWLDIQTNGFGSYRRLNENSGTLAYWEIIFQHFINHDITVVDSLLSDSLGSFFYEIVVFEDSTLNNVFHMLREQLDTSFIDINQPDNDQDDIFGGFRNGWGLFIINPNANYEQVLIQVPHPCDDFIAPYVAMDLFLEIEAFGFMIHGAGREVEWTQVGDYANNKSLSDPSRYQHTVFQKFQETLTPPLFDINPHWPIVFAIHSFDNQSHINRKSVIIAGGANNSFTTKPIRDITDDHNDIINFTIEYPIFGEQFGNHPPIHITDYYEAFYDDNFFYDNGNEEFSIVKANDLIGPVSGVQMIDLQNQSNPWSVYEPWIQIELDEKPMMFDQIEMSNESLYQQGIYPTGIDNFILIREYYQPFIEGVKNYLINWDNNDDITAPDSVEFFWSSNSENVNEINFNWIPTYDTNFKSYEIQLDNQIISNESIIINSFDYPILQYMRKNEHIISDIDNTDIWSFRIRAVDHFDNTGPWSNITSNLLPGHSPPDTVLNFSNLELSINSLEQDDAENNYGIDTTVLMPGNSPTLYLYGNNWKSINIDSLAIDSNTVLQVFCKIDSISEIQGIGFSDGIKSIKYALSGTESLDIEDWITVYQGQNTTGGWFAYNFPIGNDWIAWYDSLSNINQVYFINDNDDTTNQKGNIYFSMIRDITSDLNIAPTIEIEYTINNASRMHQRQIASISFNSMVNDTDSYTFNYHWDFGDGNYSTSPDPEHEYSMLYNYNYTVILMVEDETGKRSYASIDLDLNEENPSTPLTMNFVGDIMLGRRYESNDGIIVNQGVEAIFQPTLNILGFAADLTIANLEIVLTDHDETHPTKSIVFKSDPQNVYGLTYGGIDIVSLANNHIMDFNQDGMIQTQSILNEHGILHSGSGLNSYEAYLPAIKTLKGNTIAFLSSSDRTGQYNNYQPYLNAGENKPGFAYLTPYYLKEQIESVKNIADFTIIEMHAGSEYSLSPGSDYDSYEPPDGFESLRINPASEDGFIVEPFLEPEDEDYSWRLDRPQMWDRALRHFAIDQGADAVIVHHPHIIQGVEVYNRKLIAHSLGNFIFDLNYPETFPSMILNSKVYQDSILTYSITPVYIDNYIPRPATGELGTYILKYIANKSKELDTYVSINRDINRAFIILDTLEMNYQLLNHSIDELEWDQKENYFISKPVLLPESGSISQITVENPYISHFRLGRELIWMGNFENEGSSLWNLNSDNEFLQDSIFRRGKISVSHIRNNNSPSNIITNLENKFPFKNHLKHTLHGSIKTQNAQNVDLQLRLSESRNAETLITISLDQSINGFHDWKKYWKNIEIQESVNFFDVVMNTGIPDTGTSKVWFDDVGLIQWDTLQIISNNVSIVNNPNDYNYIQFFSSSTPNNYVNIETQSKFFGEATNIESIPKTVNRVIQVPGYGHFFDESKGAIGNWSWDFNDNLNSNNRHPSHYFSSPGIYSITLTITGFNGAIDSNEITIIALSENSEELQVGDLNNDNEINVLDLTYCSSYILGLITLSPEQFLAADIDSNNQIDIYDLYYIFSLYN